ncbi:hypothetical protein [uncultured Methanobrevibacter sp.]|uniref:hypothetical protein n=1 Tax=uncultured Methanobrevibacter sp. TaxID=253161 RepID=UPI0025DCD4B4|nr:hypothetical protein [uncultured Methanobrevibacter sp.]
MKFQFRQTNNPFHNDKSIIYLSNLAFNSQEAILLDSIISVFELPNEEDRREYLSKIKEYYLNKGMIFDVQEFDENVDNFLSKNIGNMKGTFLELLIYKLIKEYCSYDGIYKECKVTYNNTDEKNHPYDVITQNNIIKFMDIKFSCHHLKPSHLNDLVEYLDEKNVESYLISLDTFSKIENKINFLKFKNEISEEECEYFKNNLHFITNREIYEAVLDKKCLTNLGRFNY